MNYEEAKRHSFTVPWKVSECFNGPDCWCRTVIPVEPIIFDNDEEYEVIRDGSIDQPIAEYIVKLHNERLEKNKVLTDAFHAPRVNKDFESNI